MKLPKVYANKIDRLNDNNKEYYKTSIKEDDNYDLTFLKNKFDYNGYANKLEVFIKTKDKEQLEKLILCKDNYFVNINNEKIYFDDIISFELKNK